MSPVTLSLILATTPVPPESACQTLEAAADRSDPGHKGRALAAAADACREAFEAVPPDAPDAFEQRSFWAFEAHRVYLKAHKAGGADRPLCADRRLLEAFAASLATLKPGDRPHDRADVEAILKQIAALQTCEPEPAPPPVQPGPAVAPQSPGPAGVVGSTPAEVPQPEQPRLAKPAPSSAADVAPASAPTTRPRRPLRVAGATTLTVGLAAGLGAVGALVRGAALRKQVSALNAAYEHNIPAELAVDTEAGKRADRLALGLGLVGIAGTVAGITLMALDAHRARASRRFALHPSILPTAGLRFTLEF